MENKKKVAVMQPYFFPYLGYFQLINTVDTFVLYDDVNFINRGWINRNNILLNGNAHLITVPLQEASQNKLISGISIDPDLKWKTRLLKTVDSAYRKAPQYDVVFPFFCELMNQQVSTIAELNLISLKAVCDYLSISTTIVDSSSAYKNQDLKGQHRVLDICQQEKAAIYINPIGGMEIYNSQLYKDNRLELFFLKTQFTTYPQFNFEFIPGLSILDYMMFLPIPEIKKRLTEFTLVTN